MDLARTGAVAAMLWLAATAAGAQSAGISAERVLFGQTAALGGPAADLGLEMRRGILAAFEEVNRAGGVFGRRLELLSYDDRYEPELAIANTIRLIEEDDVFALIGPVGTPTSSATEPITRAAGVPFIAPFSGADFLRDPELTHVVNIRASYGQETETMIERLISDLGMTRIGVLYQDDVYGRVGLAGVEKALDRRGLKPVGAGTYMRNSTAVKTALLGLAARDPEAIIIIGAYRPSAVFTKWARKLGVDAMIFNVSFVGSDALASELGSVGDGVYITQVVPLPHGDALPLLSQFRSALLVADPNSRPSYGSLEGYIAGRLVASVLERTGDPPSRKDFLDALTKTGSFDIGGFELTYGPGDNQGSDQVFLTVIRQGAIVPADRLER